MMATAQLHVVVPVYNEAGHITALIKDWHGLFETLGITYQFIIINDGSSDESLDLLNRLKKEYSAITLLSQKNSGHGPSILKGYQLALPAEWILQIDADHQLETTAFAELWQKKEGYDLLLSERKSKQASAARNIVSSLTRMLVRCLYGPRIKDINSPYRLMRSAILQNALKIIPSGSFAPNVLISAFFLYTKKRIFTNEVTFRKEGIVKQSKMNFYMFKGIIHSASEVIKFRFRL